MNVGRISQRIHGRHESSGEANDHDGSLLPRSTPILFGGRARTITPRRVERQTAGQQPWLPADRMVDNHGLGSGIKMSSARPVMSSRPSFMSLDPGCLWIADRPTRTGALAGSASLASATGAAGPAVRSRACCTRGRLDPLPCPTAVPSRALEWRVLRAASGTAFAGHPDSGFV